MNPKWAIPVVILAIGCQPSQEWNATEILIFNYKHMHVIKSGLLNSNNQDGALGFSRDLTRLSQKYETLRAKHPAKEVDLLLAENKEINERLVFWGFPDLVRTPTKSDHITPQD